MNGGGYDTSQLYMAIDAATTSLCSAIRKKDAASIGGRLQKDRKSIIGKVSCSWVQNAPWRASLIN